MLFTLYYVYATFMQWWRLAALRNKLSGTLTAQNALVVGTPAVFYDPKNRRPLENLLFQSDERIACTVVPKQTLNLSQWVNFPKDYKYFPILLKTPKLRLSPPTVFVLVEAHLDKYVPHQSDVIQVEAFGELVAWKAAENLEIILKTDLENLTKLVHCFSKSDIDINHELRLLKVETVDVSGSPTRVRYDRKYSKEERMRYSHAPVHWKKFLNEINRLYLKIHEVKNPKIKIDQSSQDEGKKVPIHEVKPMKKELKKPPESSDSKHQLEVKMKTKEKSREKTRTTEKTTKAKPKRERSKTALISDDIKVEAEADAPEEAAKKADFEMKTEARLLNGSSGSKTLCGFTFRPELKRDFSRDSKPPNVLVYADSAVAKTNVKEALHRILNREKYVIYDMPTSGVTTDAWIDCTKLVVVCGSVGAALTSLLMQYLLEGGHLFCMCSDLLHSVLKTFSTAEVREHELVRFSYGDWKRVKMMHHIFCYQASPAKKQFSKDSDQSNNSSSSSSPVAPRTPSTVEVQHNGKTYTVQVQVLGTEEIWHTPSLLSATVKDTQGRAIFSQVHLEIDPTQYLEDEDKFAALRDSDGARLDILKHILSEELGMDCENNTEEPKYQVAYFLGKHDAKVELLRKLSLSGADGKLEMGEMTLQFCGKDATPGAATEKYLPVLVHSCPDGFSTVKYFETLNTDEIGRLVIYSEVLTSTQVVLGRKFKHGLAVIAKQQTKGSGRSSNAWISPIGSAMFSLQLVVHLDTPLGRRLTLAQHLAMVAVISAVRNRPGCENLGISIKWPNDLYTVDGVKLGGVVARSSVSHGHGVIDVGVGVNLDNKNPTTCINDLIKKYNEEKKTNVKAMEYEEYFALVFNEFERIFNVVQNGNVDYLYELYYKYWLHSGAEVVVCSSTGEKTRGIIEGIDDYGFLAVRHPDESLVSVQPDGNSFDMLKGLILPKTF